MLIPAIVLLTLGNERDLAAWGEESLLAIRRDYYLPKSKLYAERPDKKQPAFNWGVGVMLSALNAAARHDPKYKPWLREYVDASRVYWNQGGYDVLPAPKPKDRYYDDNAWMALALAETYEILGDRKYLDWAKGALDFALRGRSREGGIFWRESDRASRNTCASAPTAAACLALAGPLKQPNLRKIARELYDWTCKHLQDPADGLMWDSLSNSGKIGKDKWTYNTALMIRTAWELGQKEEALRMRKASESRWLRDGRIHDPGRFAHLILEAWLLADGKKEDYLPVIEWIWKVRNPKGYLPGNWGQPRVSENPEILDQASFVRACFEMER